MYPQDVVVCLLLPLIVSGDLVLGGQGQPGDGVGAPGAEGEHATSCQERHGGTQGDGDCRREHKILHLLLFVKLLFISLKFHVFDILTDSFWSFFNQLGQCCYEIVCY